MKHLTIKLMIFFVLLHILSIFRSNVGNLIRNSNYLTSKLAKYPLTSGCFFSLNIPYMIAFGFSFFTILIESRNVSVFLRKEQLLNIINKM